MSRMERDSAAVVSRELFHPTNEKFAYYFGNLLKCVQSRRNHFADYRLSIEPPKNHRYIYIIIKILFLSVE